MSEQQGNPVGKLLVIRFGAMGDLLHASAALAAVKGVSPQTEIHLLSAPLYQPMLEALPPVVRVWVWEKSTGWRGLIAVAAALRKEGFDAVVNLHPSFRTWVLCRMLTIPAEATYRKEKLRVSGAAQRELRRLHAMEDFARPFAALFPAMTALPLPEPALSLPAPPSLPGELTIGLIPGVGHHRANRAWPEDFWRVLMEDLLQKVPDCQLILMGGQDEIPLATRLSAGLDASRVRMVCGVGPVLETARTMAGCQLIVGGDTGPLHLAASVRVPVLGLYGPTNPQRTGPRGQGGFISVLTPPETLACWPCEQPVCPLKGEEELACMKLMTPEIVLTQCLAMIADVKNAPAMG